jgi:uncharacterized membrane protein
MEPAIVVALLWALFGAFHIGLATGSVRGRLVSRLGELGFSLLFSAFALTTASFVVVYYSQHRYEGAAGLALGTIPALRPVLVAVIVLSVAMMSGTFATYSRSPYAVLGDGEFPPPRGLERITRHPFFSGLVIFSLAHVLLATHLVGAAFVAGFGVIALVGMVHQDRKLKDRYGPAFVRYLASTSAVPFAAIIAGRQQMNWRELPAFQLAAGIMIAIALRAVHDSIFAHGGAPFLAVTVASVVLIMVQSLARRRARSKEGVAALPEQAHQPVR